MLKMLRIILAMVGVKLLAKTMEQLPIIQLSDKGGREKKLLQIRMDALTATFIYSRKLYLIGLSSGALMLGSILTPVLILVALSMPAGQVFRSWLEAASQLSSAILLIWSIAVLILRVEVKKEAFISGRAANNFIASEVLKLLADPKQDLGWFITYVSRQDTVDQENIGNVGEGLRKKSYRESLKRLFPGDASVLCEVCRLSPYKFKEGDCQLCGNKT